MHTYTAEEVVRETQGWPDGVFDVPVEYLRTDPNMPHMMAHTAIGAGLVWLALKEDRMSLRFSEECGTWWVSEVAYKLEFGEFLEPVCDACPTPLAAVSAAVRWVMEQQKKGAKK